MQTDFGTNNPWGLGGSKNKKKTTNMPSFDFGDFGSAGNNDLTFDGADGGGGATESKPDDAWGFVGKKDKKGKKDAIEEINEEPAEPEQKEEDNWGGWGAAKKTTKKGKKAPVDGFSADTNDLSTAGDSAFDWGFGSKDKKNLISEVEEQPEEKQGGGDDWLSGGWGATGKKKSKKKTDDLTASIDLNSNGDAKDEAPADDTWGAFSTTKTKKKGKKGLLDDEPPPPPEIPDAPAGNDAWDDFGSPAEPEPIPPPAEPLVAWDHNLNVKEKKAKQKQMKLEGSWESRVTQEMVDAAAAETEAAAVVVVIDPELEPEPVPEPPPPIVERVPWDHGLDAKARRKKQKEMQLDGTWADRLTQEIIDTERAEAEAAAAAFEPEFEQDLEPEPIPEPPVEPEIPWHDLVPWDQGLNAKQKKKKEKDMMIDGTWDDRITQDVIEQRRMAQESAAAVTEAEIVVIPEAEPEFDAEPVSTLR